MAHSTNVCNGPDFEPSDVQQATAEYPADYYANLGFIWNLWEETMGTIAADSLRSWPAPLFWFSPGRKEAARGAPPSPRHPLRPPLKRRSSPLCGYGAASAPSPLILWGDAAAGPRGLRPLRRAPRAGCIDGKDDSVKGTQEGFLSCSINPPCPKAFPRR